MYKNDPKIEATYQRLPALLLQVDGHHRPEDERLHHPPLHQADLVLGAECLEGIELLAHLDEAEGDRLGDAHQVEALAVDGQVGDDLRLHDLHHRGEVL